MLSIARSDNDGRDVLGLLTGSVLRSFSIGLSSSNDCPCLDALRKVPSELSLSPSSPSTGDQLVDDVACETLLEAMDLDEPCLVFKRGAVTACGGLPLTDDRRLLGGALPGCSFCRGNDAIEDRFDSREDVCPGVRSAASRFGACSN